MKYCANCGAKLQDTMKFCNKCGTAQNTKIKLDAKIEPDTKIELDPKIESDTNIVEIKQNSVKKKRRKYPIIIFIIILIIGCLGGYLLFINQNDIWNTDSEEVIVEEETPDENSITEENSIMEEDSITDEEIEFIGKIGSYYTPDTTLNITIEDQAVTSSIVVGTYEETLLGKIVSSTEAEVYLKSGEVIRYTWLDEDEVLANPVDEFKQETTNRIRPVCNALNNTTFTYQSNTVLDSQNTDFVATYMPEVGSYWNSHDGGLPDTYSIVISSVANNSFVFSVTEEADSNGNWVSNMIIDNGVAKFHSAEDCYAYYKDDTYEIQFDCLQEYEVSIAGYEPMTRITSRYYIGDNS